MKALILIDLQNDFFPGGSLAVKDSPKILPVINELVQCPFDLIIATKDWHPRNHGSFAVNHHKEVGEKTILNDLVQILWPVHCVQQTHGSEFTKGWEIQKIDKVIYKGTDPGIDSYSAFFDNGHLKSTGLKEFLVDSNVNEIYIAGVATDYCVKFSVLDALEHGFKTYVVTDGCQGVNLAPQDSQQAFNEMQKAGANLMTMQDLKETF